MVSRARRTPVPRFRVYLRTPVRADAPRFLEAVRASRALHRGWVAPPATAHAFRAYVAHFAQGVHPGSTHAALLAVRRNDDALVGVFNFSEIVRGPFQTAYLGYYGFAPLARQGYMTEALVLALDRAFGALGLHRVEANVQPTNRRSLALVRRAGFTREGYSRRYVKIAGRWRDHVRFAMLAEDWPDARRALVATMREAAR